MVAKVRVPWRQRYATSRAIFRESLSLLRKERDLWAFGWIAGGLFFAIMAIAMLPVLIWGFEAPVSWLGGRFWLIPIVLPLAMIVVTYPLGFATSLVQSALMFGLHERMARRKCTPRQAWARAWSQRGPIARFNLLAMLVTGAFVVLGQLLDKLRLVPYIGQAISTMGLLAWGVASFFVIPIMVVKGERDVIPALKQSVGLARDQWGKATGGIVTIGLVFVVPILAWMALMFAVGVPLMMWSITATSNLSTVTVVSVLVGLAFVAPFLVLFPLQMATQSAYQVALYRYAVTGKVPKAFSQATIVDAWTPYRQP